MHSPLGERGLFLDTLRIATVTFIPWSLYANIEQMGPERVVLHHFCFLKRKRWNQCGGKRDGEL